MGDLRLSPTARRAGPQDGLHYDAKNDPTRTTDATGHEVNQTVDPRGNALSTSQTFTDADGLEHAAAASAAYVRHDQPVAQTDALGHLTALEYNKNRQVVKTTDANGKSVENVYISRFELIETKYPDGSSIKIEYDLKSSTLSTKQTPEDHRQSNIVKSSG